MGVGTTFTEAEGKALSQADVNTSGRQETTSCPLALPPQGVHFLHGFLHPSSNQVSDTIRSHLHLASPAPPVGDDLTDMPALMTF